MLGFVGRLLLVAIGFILAAVAGVFVVITLGMERFVTDVQFDRLEDMQGAAIVFSYAEQLFVAGQLLAGISLIPAVLLIIVGEVARIRSMVFYVVGGGIALAAVPVLFTFSRGTGLEALPPTTLFQVLATAGFAAGLVYWAIAGRTA